MREEYLQLQWKIGIADHRECQALAKGASGEAAKEAGIQLQLLARQNQIRPLLTKGGRHV